MVLIYGAEATKYNYKNSKSRGVILQVSDDETKLMYQDLVDSGKLFQGPTSLKISKFKDLIYGGSCQNMKKHRKILSK